MAVARQRYGHPAFRKLESFPMMVLIICAQKVKKELTARKRSGCRGLHPILSTSAPSQSAWPRTASSSGRWMNAQWQVTAAPVQNSRLMHVISSRAVTIPLPARSARGRAQRTSSPSSRYDDFLRARRQEGTGGEGLPAKALTFFLGTLRFLPRASRVQTVALAGQTLHRTKSGLNLP